MAKRVNKEVAQRRPLLLRRLAAGGLITLGLLLIGLGLAHRYLYHRSISHAAPPVVATPAPVAASPPVKLVIPGILENPLETGSYQNGQWTVSEHTATYLTQSAKPGQKGNIIIYGHNRRGIFADLTKVGAGQLIVLTDAAGQEHHYTVTATTEVDPSDTSLLNPTTQETLTMYTCSGWLDSKRFIVRAQPA